MSNKSEERANTSEGIILNSDISSPSINDILSSESKYKPNPILLVNFENYENCFTFDYVNELRDLIFTKQVLKDINQHPDYQFIATGHSLGGSVATIILYDAINKGYINPNVNEPVLITFGQPRTGNEDFVLDFNKKIKNVIRVVRDGDIVVSLPYSLIKNPYRHLGGLILVNRDMTSMTYCPKEIGEDYSDDECGRSKSININYHTYYFNPDTKLSMRCQ